ncbi:hypothetical protein BN2537_1237 [Streptomyces venezuelae]|nr:hypothetical protein BN2537_1237 [Streptomyces venezuelae]
MCQGRVTARSGGRVLQGYACAIESVHHPELREILPPPRHRP